MTLKTDCLNTKNNKIESTPLKDGYFMPGEFERHAGCIIIWPFRKGSWCYDAKYAKRAFTDVIKAISATEKVYVVAGNAYVQEAEAYLEGISNIEIFTLETDDSWARDIGPTFVKNKEEKVRAVNWEFNAWGGTFDGLYSEWDKDNRFAMGFAANFGYPVYNAAPFVLEGGAIHSDGKGTVLVTESCLLSKGRNPLLTKSEIEEKLCDYLGAKKVIWIPRGIYNDETNEHVDNMCAFIRPGEVVLAWTDNQEDPQYPLSQAAYRVLQKETDAEGRKFQIHKLPIPDYPITISEKDLEGYEFEEGEDVREAGERLAASYVNFYFANDAIVMPVFGGKNKDSDLRAEEILKKCCPERTIHTVQAKDILLGGGNIHCITQQIPEGESV